MKLEINILKKLVTLSTLALYVLAAQILSSCISKQSESQKGETPLIIDIEKSLTRFQKIRLSELNSQIKYIPLQTMEGKVLRSIDDLDIEDSLIIAADYFRLLLFKSNGNIVTEVTRKGKGPTEYLGISAPQLIDGKIYVPDKYRNQLRLFDTNGIEYNQISFPNYSLINLPPLNNWVKFTDTSFVVSIININGQEKYRAVEIGSSGKVIRGFKNTTFFKLYKNNSNDHYASSPANGATHIYQFSGKFKLFHRLNDTVWQIDNSGISPAYILKRGKYELRSELFGIQRTSSIFREAFANTLELRAVFETTHHIMVSVQFRKLYPFPFKRLNEKGPMGPQKVNYDILGIYNKQTAEFFFVAPSGIDYQLEPLGIENDIDGGINFTPMYSPNKRTLVSWFNAIDLKAHVTSEGFKNSKPKFPEKKKELEALANRLKDTDNPVLMVVTMEE
jgi:hypothetical protein